VSSHPSALAHAARPVRAAACAAPGRARALACASAPRCDATPARHLPPLAERDSDALPFVASASRAAAKDGVRPAQKTACAERARGSTCARRETMPRADALARHATIRLRTRALLSPCCFCLMLCRRRAVIHATDALPQCYSATRPCAATTPLPAPPPPRRRCYMRQQLTFPAAHAVRHAR